MKTIKLTPNKYFEMWYKLADQVKKSGKVYKAVYGVKGCIGAKIVGERLGIELLTDCRVGREDSYANATDNFYKPKRIFAKTPGGIYKYYCNEILIVSDIINTGKKREQYKDFDFACLYCKIDVKSLEQMEFYKMLYLIKVIDKDTKIIVPW